MKELCYVDSSWWECAMDGIK